MGRILIVEDDKYLNKLLSDRFVLDGFEVQSALDGAQAFNFLEEAQNSDRPFDILLTDMLLPRLMGAELLAQIQEAHFKAPLRLIAMSGIYKNPAEIQAISSLYDLEGYWTKPFEISDLIEAVSGKKAEKLSSDKKTSGSGQLTDRPIEKLFLEAYNLGLTGKLLLKKEGLERRIYFSNGFPVSGDSTAISESFGRSLLLMGRINQETLEEAGRKMVEEKLQFGQMLIKMGVLTKEQLFESLRKHTYRILANTISWRDGTYEFVPMKELPTHVLALEFNSMLLIFRAHKSLYSAEFLNSLFLTKMDLFCLLSERAFQILPLLNLDEGSIRFFQSFPGTETLASILKPVPAANHEMVFRVTYLLESLGLIQWKTEPSTDRHNEVPKADFRSTFEAEKEASAEVSQALHAEYMDLLNKDYFEILDLTPEATNAEIEESYRATRYRLHPDRYGEKIGGQTKRILDDMLARIDRAYQTLIDENAKLAYMANIQRLRQDSMADSKRFLEAQDHFREGLRHLDGQDFPNAKGAFEKAQKKWDRGIEYRLYGLYCDFKIALSQSNSSQAEKILQTLKSETTQNRTMDTGFLLLGHAYQAVGKMDLAKEAYQLALKNNEKNDEAANALAKFGDAQLKKMNLSHAIKTSTSGLRKVVTVLVLLAAVIGFYFQRVKSMKSEEGIKTIDPKTVQATLPALSLRQKSNIAKVTVPEKWTTTIPDSVLNGKCVELLNSVKAHGIIEVYIFEEKAGIKAYCRVDKFRRY